MAAKQPSEDMNPVVEDIMDNVQNSNPILYQNDDMTIILIDIPKSIAHAQGTTDNPCHRTLLSSKPRQSPYPSNEPKSDKSLANLLSRHKSHIYDEILGPMYTDIIQAALKDIQSQQTSNLWCLPRRLLKDSSQSPEDVVSRVFNAMVSQKIHTLEIYSHNPTTTQALEPASLELWEDTDNALSEVVKSFDLDDLGCYNINFHNVDDTPLQFKFVEKDQTPVWFSIPPKATFLLADCEKPSKFRNLVRSCSEHYDLRKCFNFILLDPPWPNASAKRNDVYVVSKTLWDTRRLLWKMDLDQYIAASGLIGVWVTNRPDVRDLVIGSGGLFESLNVSFVEEWIYVKTTVHGEPVTGLDGLWRKPYEILLLAQAPESRFTIAQNPTDVKRRVIAAVPDLHSRKPCVKTLIEEFMPKGYQALEIFSRYLVAGWYSWGNEALKFNYDGYWSDCDEDALGEAEDGLEMHRKRSNSIDGGEVLKKRKKV
jgi:N6-adenosine-specific RNA methylase IME4